jgi:ribosomal protein L21
MRRVLFLIAALTLFAETPAGVLDLFREAAEALAGNDADAFLAKFDSNMPAYAMLREETAGLMAAYDIGSTIEVVNDEGDDQKRSLDLDWLLVLTEKNVDNGRNETRRRVVKCTVEKQGKQWKITALEPIDIFKH